MSVSVGVTGPARGYANGARLTLLLKGTPGELPHEVLSSRFHPGP
jgi:hypothetical protein